MRFSRGGWLFECNCVSLVQVSLLGVGLTLLMVSASVKAFGFPDVFDDPLKAKPPILRFGPTLPDGAPIQCPAQVDLRHPVGLLELIDLALCNNPKIAQAWASIKIQSSALGESRAAYLPTVSATYSPQQTQVNYPQFPSANTITSGSQQYANATWRLFDFGGRAANNASSYYLLQSALASHNAAIQKAMTDVIQSYFDVLTNKATVSAKERASQLALSSWQATVRRENKGVSAKSDTLQAQAALAKAQLVASRASGDYHKALAQLIFVIGLPADSKFSLQEPGQHTEKQDFKDLNAWLMAAEHDHPAIKAAKLQLESSKEKIRTARSAGLPTVDIFGSFYKNGYPNQGLQPVNSNTTTVGFSISIPIFEGFATTYKIRGAQAQAEKSEADMADIKTQILTEIVKSFADTQSSLMNLTASQKLLEAATASVDSAVKRYENGAADILELLISQNTMAEAQQERIRCVAEWRSARLRLMANAGVLGALKEGQKP